MKKNNLIISGAAAMVAVVAISGVAFSTFAAEDTTTNDAATELGERFAKMKNRFQNLSDEEKIALQEEREVRKTEMEAKRAEVDAAVDAGDYNAWLAAVGEDHPFVEKITADNFYRLQDIHELKDEIKTNYEEIQTIMDELEIEKPGKGEKGGRGGMKGMDGRHGGRGMGFGSAE